MQSTELGIRRCISPIIYLLVLIFSGAILYHATGPTIIPNLFVTTTNRDHVEQTTVMLRSSSSSPKPTIIYRSEPPELKKNHDENVAQNSTTTSELVSWPQEVLITNEKERLERVLQGASMYDKTVIVATLNDAWSISGSIFDLFLESFTIGNGTKQFLNHLVIFNFDPKAYARCKLVHPHCFALITDGIDFSDDQYFMSPGYLNLVWRKLDVLRMVLQQGYNLVFSDIDIMWFRNPFPNFNPDADFQTSCDKFWGNSSDLFNYPNTGFMYVRSNNRTIKFFNYWYDSRLNIPGKGQQGVFNAIKYDNITRDIGVKIWFLSTDHFGGFCEPAKDLSKACTMHANCCVGLNTKVHDLRVLLDDWKKYFWMKPMKREQRNYYTWSFLQLRCG